MNLKTDGPRGGWNDHLSHVLGQRDRISNWIENRNLVLDTDPNLQISAVSQQFRFSGSPMSDRDLCFELDMDLPTLLPMLNMQHSCSPLGRIDGGREKVKQRPN